MTLQNKPARGKETEAGGGQRRRERGCGGGTPAAAPREASRTADGRQATLAAGAEDARRSVFRCSFSMKEWRSIKNDLNFGPEETKT
jgi:hypothetical protein